MYGVNVKITGSGSFCPCAVNTVAFSFTPSRIGIFTAHCKSTVGSSVAVFCWAPIVLASIKTKTPRSTAAAEKHLDVARNTSHPTLELERLPWPRAATFPRLYFLREPLSSVCGFARAILFADWLPPLQSGALPYQSCPREPALCRLRGSRAPPAWSPSHPLARQNARPAILPQHQSPCSRASPSRHPVHAPRRARTAFRGCRSRRQFLPPGLRSSRCPPRFRARQ